MWAGVHLITPVADVHPRDPSAILQSEGPNTPLLRDEWLSQYETKHRCKSARHAQVTYLDQFDDADTDAPSLGTKAGVRCSSGASILRVLAMAEFPI